MSSTYNLERVTNVENNIDPTGKKWEIFHIKGSSLYEARPNPYRSDTPIPDEFQGRWTKHTLLSEQVKLFLNRAWDKAELATAKLERNNQAVKESAKKTKQTKAQKANEASDTSKISAEIKEELGDLVT